MPLPQVHVFIATSLDGFIADPDGGIDWLTDLPVPEGEDHGYGAFMSTIDAVVMGSGTFRAVMGFPEWPYSVPVTVMSRRLQRADVPENLHGRVSVTGATPLHFLESLAASGVRRVYVDGGKLISSFLRAGLVQQLILTRVPVLLGRGLPLFADTGVQRLTLLETRAWADGFVQSTYHVSGAPVGA